VGLCHVLRPLLRALRGGVTPKRLAWSLALGMVVGINPSVGLATLVVVIVAWSFGLSRLASFGLAVAVAFIAAAGLFHWYSSRAQSWRVCCEMRGEGHS
jgi:hypothetical protein